MIADGAQSAAALDRSMTAWISPAGGAQAGGDWCDVIKLSDDEVALTVGDVSGHGDAVADAMVAMRASVLRSIHHNRVPSEVLSAANAVAFTYGDGIIATAIVGLLNIKLHTLTFANAGHPPPLLLVGNRHAYLAHPPADVPLGIFPHYIAANYVIALPHDALLVLYTDGVTEHDRDAIQGEIDLAEAAQRVYDRPEADAALAIAQDIFQNGRGIDDAAIMALRTPRRRAER